MKLLFYLVGLVMLCMSFVPCSDAQECAPQAELKVSSAASHQEHSHTDEACTPFCICSCCSATACVTTIQKTQFDWVDFLPAKNALYTAAGICDVTHNIWQPPRES